MQQFRTSNTWRVLQRFQLWLTAPRYVWVLGTAWHAHRTGVLTTLCMEAVDALEPLTDSATHPFGASNCDICVQVMAAERGYGA